MWCLSSTVVILFLNYTISYSTAPIHIEFHQKKEKVSTW